MTNPEMEALAAIVRGFESMPVEARGRTLRYLADRYGDAPIRPMRPPVTPRPSERLADDSGWPR